MRLIPLSSITISPNRQRREFDAASLHELADNISKSQLQNAIVLRLEGDKHILVSGERRLRAITDIHELGGTLRHDSQVVPPGFVPYTFLGDLDPLAAEEAELDENIHRKDLSWPERAAAHSRIAKLRAAQAAAKGLPPPSTADISVEVRGSAEGVHQETTRRELIVAEHLDKPEVKGAKTLDEAWKALKKAEAADKDRQLGAAVGRTFSADLHRVIHGDSLEWMAQCPPEQFDVILTDPPYGMGADEFGDSGGRAEGAHGYADTPELALRCYSTLATEGFRIAKPQAHLYAFCDQDFFLQLKTLFASAGWEVFRTMLIWHKPSGSRAPWPHKGPQRKYETLLYAVKGSRPVLRMAADLVAFNPDENLGHGAQKPEGLYKELLTRSVHPGDVVLDPFCGTGTIFPAAHELKCRATGIELDQRSYGIAVGRVEKLKAQLELGI